MKPTKINILEALHRGKKMVERDPDNQIAREYLANAMDKAYAAGLKEIVIRLCKRLGGFWDGYCDLMRAAYDPMWGWK